MYDQSVSEHFGNSLLAITFLKARKQKKNLWIGTTLVLLSAEVIFQLRMTAFLPDGWQLRKGYLCKEENTDHLI